jgi:hypothetical protein
MEDVVCSWQGRGVEVRDMDSPNGCLWGGRVHVPFASEHSDSFRSALSWTSEAFSLRVHGREGSIGLVSKGCYGIIVIVVLEIGLVTCMVTSSRP